MLEQLDVRGYALIDHITLTFDRGFTILTGETGAGKSILAGALGLLLGFKAQPGAIRSGSEQTEVSGRINIATSPDAKSWLTGQDISWEDDTVIVRRIVKKNGRGSIYLQSSQITRAQLMELMGLLFDLHGQHEHQSLLVLDNHRKLLDRYGGLEPAVIRLKEEFTRLSALKKKHASLVSSEKERIREIDLLSFAVKEIDDASLKSGEEEELQQERTILQQHEKLFSALDSAYENTAENRAGALAALRIAKDELADAASIDPSLTSLHQRLEAAFYEIEDVADSVRTYRSEVNFSPERLEDFEERLNMIHQLEKKYGATIQEVLSYREESIKKLEELENWESNKEQLQKEIRQSEQVVLQLAGEVSEQRKAAADELEKKIESVLHNLGMPKADFSVNILQKSSEYGKPVCGPHGFDSVEFLISANTGEKLKPLKSIASGGEISRIMLAIKSVLSESDQVTSLIFDEIDAGIGGEVAVSIGEHLHNLSKQKQVLCITHLASIAVRADNHIKIEKNVYDNRTVTECRAVEGEEKVREISRMLAGDTEGPVSLQHAQELLNKFSSLVGDG